MKLSRTLLAAIIANEVRGLVCASLLALAMCHGAHAQNAPLSGLPQRGTVQGTDIIPIMPAGGPQLMQTTVLSLASVLGASGGGLVASVTLSVPT